MVWILYTYSETDVSVASFSPEKRKLLKILVNSNEEGCEIKKPKLSSSNDLIID